MTSLSREDAAALALGMIEDETAHIRILSEKQKAVRDRIEALSTLLDLKALDDHDLVRLAGLVSGARTLYEVQRRFNDTFLEFVLTPENDRVDTLGLCVSTYRIDEESRSLAEDVIAFKERFGHPNKTMTVAVDEITVRVRQGDTIEAVEDALIVAGYRAADDATR